MNKDELIKHLAQASEVKAGDVRAVLRVLNQAVAEQLRETQTIRLDGLGTFHLVTREARTGRNPRTGEAVEVPATNTIKFKPASILKEAVNL